MPGKKDIQSTEQDFVIEQELAYLRKVQAYLEERKSYLTKQINLRTEADLELRRASYDASLEFKESGGNAYFDSAVVQQELASNFTKNSEQQRELDLIPKLWREPYFGRLRFLFAGESQAEDFYIGYQDILDTENYRQYVVDWRAPIASLYYESNEPGSISYNSGYKTLHGQIEEKYQLVINKGQLERVLNITEQIFDEILQIVLSSYSSAQMKDIARTIQHEQNQIIRSDLNRNLLIQGVAGSGKTSIALHRAAYMMYANAEIKAENILLISPSEAFSQYVSAVLPNLGERNVRSLTAKSLLQQELSEVAGRYDTYAFGKATSEKWALWNAPEFLAYTKEFVEFLASSLFAPTDLETKSLYYSKSLLERLYQLNYAYLPPLQRFGAILDHLVELTPNKKDYQEEQAELAAALQGMFQVKELHVVYQLFSSWLEQETTEYQEFFTPNDQVFDEADLSLLVYFKLSLFGPSDTSDIKHLIVDELQDISLLMHRNLILLFPIPKTLLGDLNQAVRFTLDPNYWANLQELYADSKIPTDTYELLRSYRSTKEITHFSQAILANQAIEAFDRPGPPVGGRKLAQNTDLQQLLELIIRQVASWAKEGYSNAALICKQEAEAHYWRTLLASKRQTVENPRFQVNAYLEESTDFVLTVCDIAGAKGVEFDCVLVFDASSDKYQTSLDKTMLYVAVTRALHVLEIISLGEYSLFIPQDLLEERVE